MDSISHVELYPPWGAGTSQIALRLDSQFFPWEHPGRTLRCFLNLLRESLMQLRLRCVCMSCYSWIHLSAHFWDLQMHNFVKDLSSNILFVFLLGKTITSFKFSFLHLTAILKVSSVHTFDCNDVCQAQLCWVCMHKVLTRSKSQCRQSCRTTE